MRSKLTQKRMLHEDQHGFQKLCRRNTRAETQRLELGGMQGSQVNIPGERNLRAKAGYCILMAK